MEKEIKVATIDSFYGMVDLVNVDFLYEHFSQLWDPDQMYRLTKRRNETNFFDFYLSLELYTQSQILKALHLDKDVKTINSYLGFCKYSSPIIMEEVGNSAWQTVVENNIDHYGRWESWSEFWMKATPQGKQDFLNFINERQKMQEDFLDF